MRKLSHFLFILLTTVLIISGCRTNNAPTINVNSDFVTQYEVGSLEPNWILAITATDLEDGNIVLNESNVDKSKVNMNVVGEFVVTYTVKDSDGQSTSKVLTIKIIDTTAPEISGLTDLSIVIGSAEPNWLEGVTATDNFDGVIPLTMNNVDKTSVNFNVAGTYTVTYSVTDANNNHVNKSRTVTIFEPQLPTIYGLKNLTIEVGTQINWLQGITAKDANGENIPISLSNVNSTNCNVNQVGTYTVTYTVTDKNHYSTSATITVTVVDTTKPVISGLRDFQVIIGTQQPNWLEGVTATDKYDGNILPSSIYVDSSQLNMNLVGTYTVTYKVQDQNGNTTEQPITVTVVHGIPTIHGLADKTLEVGSAEPDWLTGVTSTNVFGENISLSLSNIISTVNVNEVGIYTVTYSVTDQYGSITSFINVHVVDTTSPVITLNGLGELTIGLGENYVEVGYLASDTYDSLVTVTMTGTVDTTTLGDYVLTYTATDDYGNFVTISRTVHVVVNDLTPYILDSNLKLAIKMALEIEPDEPITFEDARSLTYLDAYDSSISDLSGIEYFINLKFLYLDNNLITNINPLGALTQLENLSMTYNQIQTIDVLQTLYNQGAFHTGVEMYHIQLEGNPIDLVEDISAKNVLIHLNQNQVLVDLSYLVVDDLEGNELLNAKEISFGENVNGSIDYYDDIDVFKFTLDSETNLNIYTTSVLGLSFYILDSDGYEISYSSPFGLNLGALLNITLYEGTYYLELATDYSVSTLSMIGEYGLTIKEYVHDATSPVVTFIDSHLEDDIRYILNKPTDPITEADCLTIGGLRIHDYGIMSLSGLEKFTNLVSIDLSHNSLKDLSPLTNLVQLKYLILKNNEISDISSLSGLINLEYLILSNNTITDINPLIQLSNLKVLYLDKNKLPNIDVLEIMYQNGAFSDKTPHDYEFNISLQINLIELSAHNRDIISTLSNDGIAIDLFWQLTPDDYGNNQFEASDINFSTQVKGTSTNDYDTDWFKITVTQTSIVRLSLFGGYRNWEVYTSNLDELVGIGARQYLLSPGTYYFVIYGYEGYEYTLTLYQTLLDQNSPEVTFVDSNLENVVRNTLDFQYGIITEQIGRLITTLDGSDQSITNLSGIEYLTNVSELFLYNNQITDINPLLNLTKLRFLFLDNNPIDLSIDSDAYNVVIQLHSKNVYIDIYFDLER